MSHQIAARVPTPTALEILTSLLLGRDDAVAELPASRNIGVRAALETAILPALDRPPCLVSFSGGRDSSAVLSVAVDAARRHGLPAPIPVTLRFPDVATSDETRWQQHVLDHLRVRDREVIEIGDELDLLGPHATAVLREYGVWWPANAYVHVPIFGAARGGSVLTGAGGDELFGTRAARIVWLARRRTRPERRDVLSVGLSVMPRRVRAFVWQKRHPQRFSWLTRAGNTLVARALAREEASWPPRWDASVRHWYRTRAFSAIRFALQAIAAAYDVHVVSPFIEPPVLAELSGTGGPTGFASRTEAMTDLFGDLLPKTLLSRETKATFGRALFRGTTRAFASTWSGAGVDSRHVNVEELRHVWQSHEPDFRTALLLHAAWLSDGQANPSMASRS